MEPSADLPKDTISIPETVRKTDPRDYIPEAKFIKTATELDIRPGNPWERVQPGIGRLLYENDLGIIITGITTEQGNWNKKGLIITARDFKNSKGESTHIDELNGGKAEAIAKVIRQAATFFPPADAFEFTRKIIALRNEFQGLDLPTTAIKINKLFLQQLPDVVGAEPTKNFTYVIGSSSQSPNSEQTGEIDQFLKLAERKLSQASMTALLGKLRDDARFVDELFGKNYPFMFEGIVRFVSENRTDLKPDDASLKPKRPPQKFPVHQLIQAPITTIDELRDRLSALPLKPKPDFRGMQFALPTAEFVEINNVVEDSVSRGGRGMAYVFKMSQALAQGDEDIIAGDFPIEAILYNGKYYVGGDGNNRVAVLKALKVPFAPIMVRRVTT